MKVGGSTWVRPMSSCWKPSLGVALGAGAGVEEGAVHSVAQAYAGDVAFRKASTPRPRRAIATAAMTIFVWLRWTNDRRTGGRAIRFGRTVSRVPGAFVRRWGGWLLRGGVGTKVLGIGNGTGLERPSAPGGRPGGRAAREYRPRLVPSRPGQAPGPRARPSRRAQSIRARSARPRRRGFGAPGTGARRGRRRRPRRPRGRRGARSGSAGPPASSARAQSRG